MIKSITYIKRGTFLLTLFYCLFACKSVSETTAAYMEVSPSLTQEGVPLVDTLHCSVLVDFYSVGGGVDRKMGPYQDAIASKYTSDQYTIIKWGMEGETKFCFHRYSFPDNSLAELKVLTTTLLQDIKYVKYEENVMQVVNR